MLKTAVAGAIGLPLILLVGYAIGGAIGGAVMAGGGALAIYANTVASAGSKTRERRVAHAALAGGTFPAAEKAILAVAILVIVVAFVAGARSGVDGVLSFFNRVLDFTGFAITDGKSLGVMGAVAGAVIGGLGGILQRGTSA